MRILAAILFLLLIILQYDLWVGEGSLATVHLLQQSIEKQKLGNQQLSARNSSLEAEVQDLKQGLEAIEERARSELGMVRDGETYIQVIDKGRVTSDE
ncbi:MAG: cell division protein FtsB [Gammaproteobacteria bacterium]|nr:cell division protein FtsB [Gammaproteobacteria bacterium]